MKRRIMVTSLYGGGGGKIRYYYAKDGDRNYYCDAFLSAEASCKYILANYHIDEIVVFGTKSTYDPGDELKPIVLKEGKSFYTADTDSLSVYSLFRYRLAEYLDEIDAEKQDLRELLDYEEQEKVKGFIKQYFREKVNLDGDRKFNRFFDHLANNTDRYTDLTAEFRKVFPGSDEQTSRYERWMLQYLYGEMRDSAKMELMEENEKVTVRFIPLNTRGSEPFADSFLNSLNTLRSGRDDIDENTEIEIYMCIQSEDAADTFVLMNFMDIVRAMPNSRISIMKVATTTHYPDALAGEISDDTDKFSVTDLLAGTRAFLRYGKTDILMDFWRKAGINNPAIESLIYAMRNIDTGISLCDISDIERGINSLREFFSSDTDIGSGTFEEKFFSIVVEGIRRDYGKLLKGDSVEFIELVKWAYRKGFWQQTLTLVESRAPRDFVGKGIFYYSDSPEASEKALRSFGRIYYDLKPYEKYKMDDLDHYYIKYYNRAKSPRKTDKAAHQMEYAKLRIRELGAADDDTITAHTLCPDVGALTELLFSYYYLSDVRNMTNHAEDEFGGFVSIMADSDISERMSMINRAVDYFIHCYNIVADKMAEAGASGAIETVSTEAVEDFSKTLIPQSHKKSNKKEDKKEE